LTIIAFGELISWFSSVENPENINNTEMVKNIRRIRYRRRYGSRKKPDIL